MLWLIVRTTLYIALLAAAAWAAMVLIETPGSVEVTWGGKHYAMRPLAAVFAAAVALFGLWVLWNVLSLMVAVFTFFFTGDRTALERYWARRAHKRGLNALTESLIALSSGDGARAAAKARKAEMLLDEPSLTRLVNAQAALMAGNKTRAQHYLEMLSADRKTEVAGVKGLLTLSLDEGDTDRALRLARRAFALQPKESGTQDALLGLQAQTGDWRGARDTVRAKTRSGNLPKDVAARREAVLLLADARVSLEEGEEKRALEAARQANNKAPGLAPAAALATELMAKNDQPRKASRLAIDAWRTAPHPSIAAAFAAIKPDETPDDRRQRFRALIAAAPDHPETRMLEAELELTAERFVDAKAALGDLAEGAPTARACAIMAAIEKGQGAPEAVVRGWLAKALTATRGAQWSCDNCGFIAPDFAPLCPNCDAFDTLTWREIETEAGEHAASAAMAPLLVGEEKRSAEETSDDGELMADEADAPADDGEPEGGAHGEPELEPGSASPVETAENAPEDDEPAGKAEPEPVEGAGAAAESEAARKLEQAAAAARSAAAG